MDKLKTGIFALALSIFMINVEAASFGGQDATPTVYQVTLTKLEFQNSSGSWVTFAEGSHTFDIASVSANSAVGTIGQGSTLPPDSYTNIRFTVSRTFGLSGSYTFGSTQRCITATSNASTGTLSGGTITNVGLGTVGASDPSTQSVPLPTGAAVTSALTGLGIAEVGGAGGALQITTPAVFTIPANAAVMPSVSIDFDVANAIEFLETGSGTCDVMPQPPTITFSIN